MTLKQKETNQHTSIDIHRLIQDANTAQSFKNLFPDLQFQKVGATLRADKNSILLSSIRGTWCIKFFKDSAPAMPIFQAVEYANQLQAKGNKDHFFQVCEILASISGNNIASYTKAGEYTPTRTAAAPAAPKPAAPAAPYKPNTGNLNRSVQSFEFAEVGSGPAVGALEYLQHKINAPNLQTEFLNRLGVQFLQTSTHTTKQGKEFGINYTMQNPSIAFCTNQSNPKKGSIKTKSPHSKTHKTSTFQKQDNYIFGYENLPKKCRAILFCGGETDMLAINYHFNKYGIYALNLWSETTTIKPELIEDLKKRTSNIYTLFDNDYGKVNSLGKLINTGYTASLKAFETLGIPYINISLFSPLNDVCDVLQAGNKEDFLKFLNTSIENGVSRFSVPVPLGYKIDIGNHYFDRFAVEQLVRILAKENKLLFSGACGIGKSTMIAILEKYRKQIGVERIVFCVPTQTIALQQQQNYKDAGLLVPVIMEGSDKDDLFEAENSNLIICVYNSLDKIGYVVDDNCLLIGDEMHLLSGNIRQKVGNTFLQYAELAAKTLLMSATINPIFTTNLHELFNYKLVKVISTNNQIIKYQPIKYSGGVEADVFKYIESQKSTSSSTTLIKKNNVGLLETWNNRAKSLGKKSDINSSKKRQYKEDNKNYNSIVQTGLLAEKLDYLMFTSLLDTGNSFKFPVDSVCLVNERCATTATQTSARPRQNKETGINKDITVYNFLTGNRKTKETYDNKTSIEAIREAIAEAQKAVEFANCYKGKEALKKIEDDLLIYWEPLKDSYVPNLLKIIDNEQKRKNSFQSNSEFEQELIMFNPSIQILPEIHINLSEDIQTQQALQERKKHLTELKNETLKIIQVEDFDTLLESYYHNSTHIIRNRIKEITNIEKEPTAAAKALTEKYKTHFEENVFDTIVCRYFQLKGIFDAEQETKGQSKATHQKIITTILQYWKASTFKEFVNSKVADIEINKKELNGVEALRVINYQTIVKDVKRAKNRFKMQASREARENELFSKFDVIECVTGAKENLSTQQLYELEEITGIKKDHTSHLLSVKELFQVSSTVQKIEINSKLKRRTFYKIGRLKKGVIEGLKRDVYSEKSISTKNDQNTAKTTKKALVQN